MAYYVYLGEMPCPVTPSKIDTKIKGQNKTLTLINDTEINMLKSPGLTEFSFDLLLPNVNNYPFRNKELGFERANAKFYLDELERMKLEKKPFYFKIVRTFPDGKALYDNNIKVSLEDYTIKEDAKQGFDVIVSVKLKQYNDYGTKIINVNTGSATTQRSIENAMNVKEHIVEEGDTLWNIAKRYYGDGSKYPVIQEANKNIIGGSSNMIYSGMVLTIPNPTQDVRVKSGGTSVSSGTIAPSTTVASGSVSYDTSLSVGARTKRKTSVSVVMEGDRMKHANGRVDYQCDREKKTKYFLASQSCVMKVDQGSSVRVTVQTSAGTVRIIGGLEGGNCKHSNLSGQSDDGKIAWFEESVYEKAEIIVMVNLKQREHGGGYV